MDEQIEIEVNETFHHGKVKNIIEIQKNEGLTLKFCKKYNEDNSLAHETSLNYIFKIKSGNNSNFANYSLDDDTVKPININDKKQSSAILTIPKVLSEDKSKPMPGVYYIRLYANSTFDPKDYLQTISFISYFAYATYIYNITEEDKNCEPFNYTIKNFPEDQVYRISILAVIRDGDNEEIFAYKPVIDIPKSEPNAEGKGNNNLLTILLSVGLSVGAILLGIAIYFIVRMLKKKKQLDKELSIIVGVVTEELDHESQKKILL
jgi:hypothetical protein